MYDTIYKRISYVKCVLLFLCRTHMSHDDKATKVVVSYVAVKGDNNRGEYPLPGTCTPLCVIFADLARTDQA